MSTAITLSAVPAVTYQWQGVVIQIGSPSESARFGSWQGAQIFTAVVKVLFDLDNSLC